MTQSSDSDTPARAQAIEEAVDAKTAQIRTVLPGSIVRYNHTEQKAEVQPSVRLARKNPDTGETVTYLPNSISNCPVQFPAGKGQSHAETWPLKKGDRVTLYVASRSLDRWLSKGGDDVAPEIERRHDLSDCIVDPRGPRSFGNALSSSAIDAAARVIYTDEQIHLGKSQPSDWIALASKAKSTVNSLISSINTFIGTYNGHTHPYITPLIPLPPTPTSPPVPQASTISPTTDQDYKSSKVKSE
jgi:hypothetical protein